MNSTLPRIPEIQGLRGLAITMVVLYHGGLALSGGFVGVDVFFVVSGFVIGRLVWTEFLETNRISWTTFFRRRAWRLLPLYSLTMVAVVVWDFVEGGPALVGGLRAVLRPATYFATNWFFFLDRSYVDLDGHPLRHLWSLAVEEQFYIAMPVLLVVLLLAHRRSRHGRWWVIGTVGAISLAGSVVLVDVSLRVGVPQFLLPERFAFFSPATRAWEFVVGVAVAVGTAGSRDAALVPLWVGRAIGEALSVLGLGAIAVSAAFLDSWQPFPGVRSIPVVAGSAALVGFAPGSQLVGRVLRAPALVRLGDYSYGLYLVHWPLLVLIERRWGDALALRIAVLVASLGVAVLLARYFERPTTRLGRRSLRGGTAILIIVAVAPLIAAELLARLSARPHASAVAAVGDVRPPRQTTRNLGAVVCLDEHKAHLPRRGSACVEGTLGGRLVALVGDSHAYSVSEGVVAAARRAEASIYTWSRSGCPFLVASSPNRLCNGNRDRVTEDLRGLRPDVVVVVNGINHYLEGLRSERQVPWGLRIRLAAAAERTAETVRFLRDEGFAVILVLEVPTVGEVDGVVSLEDLKVRATYAADLRGRLADLPDATRNRVRIVEPAERLCPNGRCGWSIGGVVRHLDDQHLNADGALLVSPLFDEPLAALLGVAGGLGG
jgi:peptidoglycan/LPS O-acetylase OafA/YrhL